VKYFTFCDESPDAVYSEYIFGSLAPKIEEKQHE